MYHYSSSKPKATSADTGNNHLELHGGKGLEWKAKQLLQYFLILLLFSVNVTHQSDNATEEQFEYFF